jgi:hypothetical protein
MAPFELIDFLHRKAGAGENDYGPRCGAGVLAGDT